MNAAIISFTAALAAVRAALASEVSRVADAAAAAEAACEKTRAVEPWSDEERELLSKYHAACDATRVERCRAKTAFAAAAAADGAVFEELFELLTKEVAPTRWTAWAPLLRPIAKKGAEWCRVLDAEELGNSALDRAEGRSGLRYYEEGHEFSGRVEWPRWSVGHFSFGGGNTPTRGGLEGPPLLDGEIAVLVAEEAASMPFSPALWMAGTPAEVEAELECRRKRAAAAAE